MTALTRQLFPKDNKIFQNFIIGKWHLKHYFPSSEDQQIIATQIWNYLVARQSENIFAYDGDELVGAAFYGVKTKKNGQPLIANRNFQYLFDIKASFEQHILDNKQKDGMVFFFYAKTQEAVDLLTREISRYVQKRRLRILFFCELDCQNIPGKTVHELTFPINEHEDLVVHWGGSYFSPARTDNDIEFGIYGRQISTNYLYNEFHPCVDPQCKRTILLIHGMATDHQTWRDITPIMQRFANVVLVDLPMHGRSNVFPLNEIEWDLSMMGLYISQFIRERKFTDLIIWGHSLGGGVAILVWLYDRKIINGLILEDAYNPGALKSRSGFIHGLTLAIRNQIYYTRWRKEKSNAKLVNEIQMNTETNDVIAVYRPLTKQIFTFFSNLLNENELLLADFAYRQNQALPTLVMVGANDYVINMSLSEKYFASLTKNYHFVFVPFSNHSPHMNNPRFTEAEVFAYLARVIK